MRGRRLRSVLAAGVAVVSALFLTAGSGAGATPNWTVVSSPNASSSINGLTGVSCTSATFCMADGEYYPNGGAIYQTLIEEWNGTTWSVLSSPNTSSTESNGLTGMSCTSLTFCMATGNYSNGTHVQTLIEEWNGTSWAIVSSPNPSTTQDVFLYGVSCTSATFCMTAGIYNSNMTPVIEKWNGTSWTLVSAPNPSADSELWGVSCTSATFCVATGFTLKTKHFQTLIEKWNGTSWVVASSPNASIFDNELYGVDCTSATFCMAVGGYLHYYRSRYFQNLFEKWNGTSWTIVSSPNTSTTQDNNLFGVSCTSATFCMAIGQYSTGTSDQTLAVAWNGKTLKRVSSPNPGTDSRLYGVRCTNATFCMSAGQYYNGTVFQTLIEKW